MKRYSAVSIGFLVLLLALFAAAQNKKPAAHESWIGTWACSPQLGDPGNAPPAPGFNDATLRQIVHVSVGGRQLRLRFSNTFGERPLTIVATHIALSAGHDAIQPGTDKALSFHGQSSVTIPAGALMISDPLSFDLKPDSDLVVSIYMESAPEGISAHPGSRETSYLHAGNMVSAESLPGAAQMEHWYFLNGIDVVEARPAGAIVALGDSITDGHGSITNGNGRWTDYLARRLESNKGTSEIAMLNQGIGGNRLLHDGLGPNALARLDRDVIAQTAVRWLIVFEGVNDIGTVPRAAAHHEQPATADDIIAAYEQIILRAHAHGIRVYGATITPFGGSFYDSPAAETERTAVNEWIRSSGQFDAVLDFDAAIRDPKNPLHMLPAADSGDHLHPNDTGYRMLANSVNLKLF